MTEAYKGYEAPDHAEPHDVVYDTVGLHGRSRYTCVDCGGETLVRQPYMTATVWAKELVKFYHAHPCDVTKRAHDSAKEFLDGSE